MLTLGLEAGLSAQVVTLLQPRPSSSLSGKLPNRWNFNPPRGRGISINRQGGATRGSECLQGKSILTALVPASGVGATAAPYPTIFWYMPKSAAPEMELVLENDQEQQIYSAQYSLAKSSDGTVQGTPGVMSLALPAYANLPPLEIGQDYYWKLAVICDSQDRSSDVTIGGGIVRVKPSSSLAQNIQRATPQERVALYANDGLWYETLETLVKLRRERPNDTDLTQAWNKLLNSVDLDTTFRTPQR
ncbi:MAG: hypothetical protein Fur006_62240 [Coleofasciculaceae cyanobacterium]